MRARHHAVRFRTLIEILWQSIHDAYPRDRLMHRIMHRLSIVPLALLLGAWVGPDFPALWEIVPPPQDCRQPAIYNGALLYGRAFSWKGSRLIASFVLRNDSPDPVIVNGPMADGIVLTEFELISPEGPRYDADWRTTKGVFRRQGFPPLAPNASATSTIQFDAQRRPYTLHFHRQLTIHGATKLQRSAFVCSIP